MVIIPITEVRQKMPKLVELETIHPEPGDTIVMVIPADKKGAPLYDTFTIGETFSQVAGAFPEHRVVYIVGNAQLERMPAVHWQRCEDGKPEDGQDVFICCRDGVVGEGQYNERWGIWIQYKRTMRIPDEEVIAWAELPLPLVDKEMARDRR